MKKKVILSIEKERQNWQTSLKRKRLSYKLAPATLPKISDGDFGFLKQICAILKVFLDETLKFSKEISTASQIIPTYTMLKKFLTDQTTANTSSSQNIAKFIEKLLDGLTGRLSALSNKRILFYAMIVDPRFSYDPKINTKLSWELIQDEFIKFCKKSK